MKVRHFVALLVCLPIAFGAWGLYTQWKFPDRGVARQLWSNESFAGEPVLSDETRRIEVGFVDAMDLARSPFSVRWHGIWQARRNGRHGLEIDGLGNARVRVFIDGRPVALTDGREQLATIGEFNVRRGDHLITLEYQSAGRPSGSALERIRVALRRPGRPPRRLDTQALYPRAPETDSRAPLAWVIAVLTGTLSLVSLLGISVRVVGGPQAAQAMANPVVSARRWWASLSPARRVSAALIPTFVIAYVSLLLVWFGDPGSVGADGIRLRANPNGAFFVVTIFLGLVILWLNRPRLARLASEARKAWKLERLDVLALVGLLSIAAATQMPVILNSAGALDSDAALHGLAAMHIHAGRQANAFLYGKLYIGTLSSHLLAASFFVTGPTVAGLFVITRIWFAIFLTAQFMLLRFGFGRFVAVAAVLWLALPPHLLLRNLAYTEYAELLAFASVGLMIAAARICGRLKDDLWYLLAGVAFGLGFWGHQVLAPMIIGVGVAVFLLLALQHARAALRLAAAGFLLGSLPAIVGWGSRLGFFASFLLGNHNPESRSVGFVGSKFGGFFGELMPALTGFEAVTGDGGTLIVWLMVAFVVLPLGWAFVQLRQRRSLADEGPEAGDAGLPTPSTAVAMFLAMAVFAHLALYAVADFGVTARHQVPMYLGLAGLLFASLNACLARASRLVTGGVLGATTLMLVALSVPTTLGWWAALGDNDDRIQVSIAMLKDAGITRCQATFWEAYSLNYASLEDVICFCTDLPRDPHYRVIVQSEYPDLMAPLVADRRSRGEIDRFVESLDEGARVLETPAYLVAIPLPEAARQR